MGVDGAADEDGDNDAKYVKRQSALQRGIRRFLPAALQPTLPVTTRSRHPLSSHPKHPVASCTPSASG